MAGRTWWLARGEAHVPTATDWLTPDEGAYADRQRFTKRRTEFLVARFTAKTALTRTLGLPATTAELRRVEIRHEPSGAPFVCVDGVRSALRVSLTDRAGWAVCLVARGRARVGCDLELVEPRSAAFVSDYFTAHEQRQVRMAPDTADVPVELAANLIWSAKESALKLLGTGLRRDTRSVEVRLHGLSGQDWHALTASTDEGQMFFGWWIRYGDFVLTVAGERAEDPPAALEHPVALASARPEHSWMHRPALTPSVPFPAPPRR